ncbi:MAG TPA: tetratricopeptide repeat protein [Rhodanobacteraceae bacterium]|nr:tetratricopeptide repeat protein [Rhodanobacteraceae bacterium]
MLEDLLKLHRAGRLDEAEAGYRQCLAAAPDDVAALHLLGILRGQRGDAAEGIQLLERAAGLDPENAACQQTLGELYLSVNQLPRADAAYDRARRLNPNLGAAHVGLGLVALRRGDAANAESDFKAALRVDADDVQALAGLGHVAGLRGDSADAIKWLTAAAKLAPADPAVQTSYARAMLDGGMLDFAAAALDNALAASPADPAALALRAEVHLRKGEFVAARALFEALVARGDQVAAAQAGLGDVARAEGQNGAAVAHYDAALRAQPDLHAVAVRRAEALAARGDAAQAIAGLRAHLADHPDGLAVHVLLARLLAHGGRFDEAAQAWQAACARWPDDVDLKARYALALDAAGADADAQAMAEQAAASARPGLVLLRARGALLAGDPATAVARLQAGNPSVVAKFPPPIVRRRQRLLGLAFDALEQWSDAVGAFLAAHRVDAAPLPDVPLLDAPLRAWLQQRAREPALADAGSVAPVLLCGLPGSGLPLMAALLADQPGWVVRRDRFEASRDFIDAPFDPRLLQPLATDELERLAARYRQPVAQAGIAVATRIADWIPLLDARVVPALRRALPDARLVIVERRPEDTLLNWLGFGWAHGYAMPDVAAGARWLRLAYTHLDVAADLLPSLRIDPEAALGSQGEQVRGELAAFVGAASLEPGPFTLAAGVGRGGLPVRFPSGRAVRYREILSDAFALLGDEVFASRQPRTH